MKAVASLWVGDALSRLENLSIRSFLHQGHAYDLYAYGSVANVPDGCRLCDASRILPQSRVFRYSHGGAGTGSLAGFADLFRFKLILTANVFWADTDILCLQPLETSSGYLFGWETPATLGSALLGAPIDSLFAAEAYAYALQQGDDIRWGQIGPRLVTWMAHKHNLTAEAKPLEAFYPIPFRSWEAPFAPDRRDDVAEATRSSAALHLWSEMMRRSAFDKNAPWEAGSWIDAFDRSL